MPSWFDLPVEIQLAIFRSFFEDATLTFQSQPTTHNLSSYVNVFMVSKTFAQPSELRRALFSSATWINCDVPHLDVLKNGLGPNVEFVQYLRIKTARSVPVESRFECGITERHEALRPQSLFGTFPNLRRLEIQYPASKVNGHVCNQGELLYKSLKCNSVCTDLRPDSAPWLIERSLDSVFEDTVGLKIGHRSLRLPHWVVAMLQHAAKAFVSICLVAECVTLCGKSLSLMMNLDDCEAQFAWRGRIYRQVKPEFHSAIKAGFDAAYTLNTIVSQVACLDV